MEPSPASADLMRAHAAAEEDFENFLRSKLASIKNLESSLDLAGAASSSLSPTSPSYLLSPTASTPVKSAATTLNTSTLPSTQLRNPNAHTHSSIASSQRGGDRVFTPGSRGLKSFSNLNSSEIQKPRSGKSTTSSTTSNTTRTAATTSPSSSSRFVPRGIELAASHSTAHSPLRGRPKRALDRLSAVSSFGRSRRGHESSSPSSNHRSAGHPHHHHHHHHHPSSTLTSDSPAHVSSAEIRASLSGLHSDVAVMVAETKALLDRVDSQSHELSHNASVSTTLHSTSLHTPRPLGTTLPLPNTSLLNASISSAHSSSSYANYHNGSRQSWHHHGQPHGSSINATVSLPDLSTSLLQETFSGGVVHHPPPSKARKAALRTTKGSSSAAAAVLGVNDALRRSLAASRDRLAKSLRDRASALEAASKARQAAIAATSLRVKRTETSHHVRRSRSADKENNPVESHHGGSHLKSELDTLKQSMAVLAASSTSQQKILETLTEALVNTSSAHAHHHHHSSRRRSHRSKQHSNKKRPQRRPHHSSSSSSSSYSYYSSTSSSSSSSSSPSRPPPLARKTGNRASSASSLATDRRVPSVGSADTLKINRASVASTRAAWSGSLEAAASSLLASAVTRQASRRSAKASSTSQTSSSSSRIIIPKEAASGASMTLENQTEVVSTTSKGIHSVSSSSSSSSSSSTQPSPSSINTTTTTTTTTTPMKKSVQDLSVAIPSSVYPLLSPSNGAVAQLPSSAPSSSHPNHHQQHQQPPSTPSLHTPIAGLVSPMSTVPVSTAATPSHGNGARASPVPSSSNGPSPSNYTSPTQIIPVWAAPLPAPVLNPSGTAGTPLLSPAVLARTQQRQQQMPQTPRSSSAPSLIHTSSVSSTSSTKSSSSSSSSSKKKKGSGRGATGGGASTNPLDTLDLLVGVAMQSASKANASVTTGVKRGRPSGSSSATSAGGSAPKKARKRSLPTTTARRGPLNFSSPENGLVASSSSSSFTAPPSTTPSTPAILGSPKVASTPRSTPPATPKGGKLKGVRDGGVAKKKNKTPSSKASKKEDGYTSEDDAVPREPQRIVLYPYSKLTREQQKAQHRMTSALKTADAEAILTDPTHAGMTKVDPPGQREQYIVGQKVLCKAFIPYRHPRLHISNIISTSANGSGATGRTTTAFIPNVTVECWLDVPSHSSEVAVELETPVTLQGARVTRRHLKLDDVMLMEAHLSCGSKQVPALIPILRHLNRCETAARAMETVANSPKGSGSTPRTPRTPRTPKRSKEAKNGDSTPATAGRPGRPKSATKAATAAAAASAAAAAAAASSSAVATLLAAVAVEERRSPKTSPVTAANGLGSVPSPAAIDSGLMKPPPAVATAPVDSAQSSSSAASGSQQSGSPTVSAVSAATTPASTKTEEQKQTATAPDNASE